MVGWALRTMLLWGLIGGACLYAWNQRADLLAMGASEAGRPGAPSAALPVAANRLSFRPDAHGHIFLEAAVNGASTRFLVDTGASYVTLTPDDARAAGIGPGELHFTRHVGTANGQVRVAPVKLRELRLDQLTMEDVDAVVVESPLGVSLLGMSFLKRLDGYEMRDGALTVLW
jgi:aspartyl protease family protein